MRWQICGGRLLEYLRLIDSCRIAIKNEWCLGCQALENPNFRGRHNCEGSKPPPPSKKVQENIAKCKEILGIQERIKV